MIYWEGGGQGGSKPLPAGAVAMPAAVEDEGSSSGVAGTTSDAVLVLGRVDMAVCETLRASASCCKTPFTLVEKLTAITSPLAATASGGMRGVSVSNGGMLAAFKLYT